MNIEPYILLIDACSELLCVSTVPDTLFSKLGLCVELTNDLIATYAKLDIGSDNKGKWTTKNVIDLMDECEALYHNDSEQSDS